MVTDLVRVRVLAVPDLDDDRGHAGPRCVCAEWALEWKDHLLRGLPASARGRIDLDVEMAHPRPAEGEALAATARLGVPGVLLTPPVPAQADPAAADRLVVALTDRGPGPAHAATLAPDQDNGRYPADVAGAGPALRDSARDVVAAKVEEFGPDLVLALGTGSVVAYEALAASHCRVPLFVSIRCPLAVPRVFASLTPAPTHALGAWPAAAEHWIDLYDRRDPVAARRPLIDHFDGPVADRPVSLGADSAGEREYLSCPTLGILLEDFFGRRRVDRSLPAELRAVLCEVCADERAINGLLQDIGFPIARLSSFVGADERWAEVMHELVSGTLLNGVDRLIERARHRYPDNARLQRLRRECNRPASSRR
ncbi:effector-associated domain EAD1-containing protein [Actinoplanes sp. NPDC049118]|uniref:effector-associated domain EAD1-containing protein n=1 Tax=Actinoplanes sp. NPDC049118 TaxID=3155769 RepID=UPI003402DC8C